jgi:threonylcarbamoyladenosine tRNA methylthiotransferase MtaB
VIRIGFHTFGCKLNQHETEALASAFSGGGFSVCGTKADADLYVVNTCTVTSAGDHKARSLVRSLLRGHPGTPVIVTGCSAQLEAASIERLGVDVVVVPQEQKSRLLGLPDCLLSGSASDLPRAETIRSFLGAPGPAADPFAFRIAEASFHSRAFLKVQDGCDRHCAYCRVPLARGPSVSLGADEAARRAAELEACGFREIVVTGVNVSAWREAGSGPSLLVQRLLAGTLRARVRMSSLEPESIDEELAGALADPRICPHFHLPLQSGSDRVLQAMGRRYTAETAAGAVDRLRRVKHDPFIAADMLTGFPGETEEDFASSRSLVERLGFSQLHVFPFSPRPGTSAAGLKNQVPERARGQRAAVLGDISRGLAAAYRARWGGREVETLLEKGSGSRWLGTCGNYLKVWICGVPSVEGRGSLVRAVLGSEGGDGRYIGPA